MKNKRLIILGMIVFFIVGTLICVRVILPSGIHATENVGDYNTAEYPLYLPVFLDKLPLCAEVVSFSYYNYWHEASDYYLELKFYSPKDMEDYLSEWQAAALEFMRQERQQTDREWFITDKNPYDPSYTDVFCTSFITFSSDEEYTGYSIEPSKNPPTPTYNCNFGLISYSFDELTVIQTYVHGHFQGTTHHHTPRFFLRFSLPLDKKHERRLYFD